MSATRFVVLRHEAPGGAHYDLMLEREQGKDWEEKALRTWRTAGGAFPTGAGEELEALGEHRRHYLSHEGDVGEGRGAVRRVESGTWALEHEDHEGLTFRLQGERLVGRFRMIAPPAEGTVWRFEKID